MSNDLTLAFSGKSIRIHIDPDGSIWFVAKDACAQLDITWDGKTLGALRDYEKGSGSFPTPGGYQTLVTISESGFYRLAFRSNKEAARRFTDWVVEEVIPSIRKTGTYVMPDGQAQVGVVMDYRLSPQPPIPLPSRCSLGIWHHCLSNRLIRLPYLALHIGICEMARHK